MLTIKDLHPDSFTFDAVDFGNYTPRGYDPSKISGKISGVPIEYLFSGNWLTNISQSGTMLVIKDRNGKEIHRIHLSRG